MILHFEINIKVLFLEGKNYPWPRPEACPCCDGKRLWGHGYTPRYFDEITKIIWLKRYRCVDCCSVHTLRPKTHWRRFQSTIAKIITSLRSKMEHNRWLSEFSRQRQEYWLQGLKKQIKIIHPADRRDTILRLKDLLARGVIAVTHSLRWRQMIIGKIFTYVPQV